MIYKVIRPYSLTDSNLEQFEYLISWIGRDGGQYMKMIYNIELTHSVASNINNTEKAIFANITEISDIYTFTIEDLSLNDLQIFQSIPECVKVYRIYKNSIEELAPLPNDNTIQTVDKRYNYTFSLRQTDKKRFKH